MSQTNQLKETVESMSVYQRFVDGIFFVIESNRNYYNSFVLLTVPYN